MRGWLRFQVVPVNAVVHGGAIDLSEMSCVVWHLAQCPGHLDAINGFLVMMVYVYSNQSLSFKIYANESV